MNLSGIKKTPQCTAVCEASVVCLFITSDSPLKVSPLQLCSRPRSVEREVYWPSEPPEVCNCSKLLFVMDYKDQADCTIFYYCQENECSKSPTLYENTAKQGQKIDKKGQKNVHYNITLQNERKNEPLLEFHVMVKQVNDFIMLNNPLLLSDKIQNPMVFLHCHSSKCFLSLTLHNWFWNQVFLCNCCTQPACLQQPNKGYGFVTGVLESIQCAGTSWAVEAERLIKAHNFWSCSCVEVKAISAELFRSPFCELIVLFHHFSN